MLAASLARILAEVPDDALVLDIGGWGKPLARADWVIDLMPYETRGLYGRDGDGPERFTASTWVQRDICDREPFPFDDGHFDFVVCSHTLEDIRDPIWVCSEMNRIGKAGYIEVPSRLEEQTYGVQGPWVGWSHHRWLVDITPNHIEFVFKHHTIHGRTTDHLPRRVLDTLTEAQRVQSMWWTAPFGFAEHILLTPEEWDSYVIDVVTRHRPDIAAEPPADLVTRLRRRVARFVAPRGR